jgi:hypothetical protein
MRKKISGKHKKESHRNVGNALLLVALFACVVFLSNEVTNAIATSATVGDRELPIYCVDTTENKIALSFDAAWGARRMLCFRILEIKTLTLH